MAVHRTCLDPILRCHLCRARVPFARLWPYIVRGRSITYAWGPCALRTWLMCGRQRVKRACGRTCARVRAGCSTAFVKYFCLLRLLGLCFYQVRLWKVMLKLLCKAISVVKSILYSNTTNFDTKTSHSNLINHRSEYKTGCERCRFVTWHRKGKTSTVSNDNPLFVPRVSRNLHVDIPVHVPQSKYLARVSFFVVKVKHELWQLCGIFSHSILSGFEFFFLAQNK